MRAMARGAKLQRRPGGYELMIPGPLLFDGNSLIMLIFLEEAQGIK